ncbi:unnamed protein product [Staurois parvus]|uniref:Uncharacterized protein n=1 Tax=Staurois parvus TaxID=386267 RepID=A0ABN9DCH2_9NEOB|nr:unnamed protein product [Staurois parvus]
MYIHTHTHTRTYTQTCTYTHVYINRHVQTRIHTDTYTCTYIHINTPYKKLQYFVVHSQRRVLHSRGRQRAQHTLLPLLSLRSSIEQSDGSQCH